MFYSCYPGSKDRQRKEAAPAELCLSHAESAENQLARGVLPGPETQGLNIARESHLPNLPDFCPDFYIP